MLTRLERGWSFMVSPVRLASLAQMEMLQQVLDAEPALLAARDQVVSASAGVSAPARVVSWGGAVTLPSGRGFLDVTLVGNVTLSLPARGGVAEIVNLVVRQDATGSRTLTVPDALVAFKVPLVLSVAPASVDFLSLVWTGVEWLLLPGAMSMGRPS